MPVKSDIRPKLQEISAIPVERLRVVQHATDFDIANIRRGIIFVFAIWSGPAEMTLRRFTELLSSIELGSLEVIILDNDAMVGDDMIRLFGHVFHGAGETLWVRDGRVIKELSVWRPESDALVLSCTKDLVS